MSETNEAVVINQRTDKVWTDYLATAYAEGFCEGADGTPEEVMEAWAYLINTKLAFKLQGRFGRQATVFIEMGLISPDGVIDWDEFDAIKTEGLE